MRQKRGHVFETIPNPYIVGNPIRSRGMFCQNLIDRLNMEERNTAGESDVAAAAREIEDNPLPQMICFWDSFT